VDAIAAAAALSAVDAYPLELLVQRLRAVAVLLRDLAAGLGRASPPGWSGAGQRAYDAAAGRAVGLLERQAGVLEVVGPALVALSATLSAVQSEAAQGRRIAVVDSTDAAGLTSVSSQLQLALQAFDDADRRTAALLIDAVLGVPLTQLGRVGSGVGAGFGVVSLRSRAAVLLGDATRPRRIPGDAVGVTLWWAGLSTESQAALRAGPLAALSLAALDGMPAKVRDAINRVRLGAALASAEREAAAHGFAEGLLTGLGYETKVVARQLPWPLSWVATALTPDTQRLHRRVKALQELTKELRRPGSELLSFDGRGDGRAVVASGDVESSVRIAVLVPGMSTELEDVPRLIDASDAVAAAAGAGTVAVAWLGYDAPTVLQVASDAKAKIGAKALRLFTEGVRATAAVRQRVTVIGHSYGTLVAAIAARQAPAPDDLVLVGSPGVEAKSAADLTVPAGHVWAARSATDPIEAVFLPGRLASWLGLPAPLVFGPDPTSAAFGATHFSVGGAYGHSGYYTSGSQSLANLGRIVAGRPTS
jgi:hypothetical protein